LFLWVENLKVVEEEIVEVVEVAAVLVIVEVVEVAAVLVIEAVVAAVEEIVADEADVAVDLEVVLKHLSNPTDWLVSS
jgi:hypothetical protein